MPSSDTQFKEGNPGRKKGSRNKLNQRFFDDVLAVWEQSGIEAVRMMAIEKPGDFAKMVAQLAPKDITLLGDEDAPIAITEIKRVIVDPTDRNS
jgi:hypothetical protein